jgi:hypothetical protein
MSAEELLILHNQKAIMQGILLLMACQPPLMYHEMHNGLNTLESQLKKTNEWLKL